MWILCVFCKDCSKGSVRFWGFCIWFLTWLGFYGVDLLAPYPTPKLQDHPMLAVCDSLFNIFAATLHLWRSFLHLQPEDTTFCGDRDNIKREL
jgi:hypothetical protein